MKTGQAEDRVQWRAYVSAVLNSGLCCHNNSHSQKMKRPITATARSKACTILNHLNLRIKVSNPSCSIATVLPCVKKKLNDALISNQGALPCIRNIHSFRSNFDSEQAKGIIRPSLRRRNTYHLCISLLKGTREVMPAILNFPQYTILV
jgi:hypothetical protein